MSNGLRVSDRGNSGIWNCSIWQMLQYLTGASVQLNTKMRHALHSVLHGKVMKNPFHAHVSNL
jgi:hypothetical protein